MRKRPPSDGTEETMDIHHLVKMANQIGDFFSAYPDRDEVVHSIKTHLKNSWDLRMRRQIIEYVEQTGGADLKDPVRVAVLSLGPACAHPGLKPEESVEDEAPGDD
jgi:formate dehydrogenase subunit delta